MIFYDIANKYLTPIIICIEHVLYKYHKITWFPSQLPWVQIFQSEYRQILRFDNEKIHLYAL